MDSMKVELEEKIRKLEEDKHNMDISAGISGSRLYMYNRVVPEIIILYHHHRQHLGCNSPLTPLVQEFPI